MAPSKLEKCLDVLEVLAYRPKRLDNIAYVTKMECHAVKQSLGFLISHDLVEERSLRNGKRIIYSITERGVSVLKTLQTLKYLEKLKITLPIIEEAGEIAPIMHRHRNKPEEE